MYARFRRRRWFALACGADSDRRRGDPSRGIADQGRYRRPTAPPRARPGFTDLDTLTYAQAKQRLDELSTITLPVSVPGLELIDVNDVRLGSNDAGRSLSLTGSANLPASQPATSTCS